MTAMDMDPALWGTLPNELLQLVFSRLAVAEICQLRLLSKDWKRDIDTGDSEFSRVLEKTTYPSMFGLIAWRDHGEFRGMVVDVTADRRHVLEIDAAEDAVITMGAADGGLICFVSESFYRPLFLVVMNPLTRKKIVLSHLLSRDGVSPDVKPTMVQLTMDRDTSPGWAIYYYISEYVLEKNSTAWVKVGTISDLPFADGSEEYDSGDDGSDDNFTLHACNGFLMIFGKYGAIGDIYNLSTCDWLELPKIWPGHRDDNDDDSDDDYDIERDHCPLDLMCELRWDAIP